MRINHNIPALNTYRQLSINNDQGAKSIEKLSSGLRINRAGDDAAGLAISEKMRAQIRGLDQASRNAQDGISMVQTAEGALTETHSILQRMRELANQSANDTNVSVDRGEIQKEINQLTSEINRIGNTTEFNTQKLLNGGGASVTSVKKGGGVAVPASLSNGEGAAVAQLKKTFTVGTTFDNTDVTGDDGKKISFTFGEKTYEFTLNRNLTLANSTATQIGISNVTTANLSAQAVHYALTAAFTDDDYLPDNFTLAAYGGAADVVVTADDLSFAYGELKGTENGASGNITMLTDTSLDVTEAVTTANAGAYASATLDFTGKTISDVKGTGFSITNSAGHVINVNLYDSTDGAYTGSEDATNIAVDLKGAGNAEAIVDKIVTGLFKSTGGTTKLENSAGTDFAYASKSGSSLLISASSAGVTGNLIKLDNNSPLTVSNFTGSTKLDGESVVSAKGLKDGAHEVKITYQAAAVTEAGVKGAVTAAAHSITVGSTTALDSGTYRLTNQGVVAHAQLQKLGSDGSTWTTVTGYEDITITGASQTIGDLTYTGTAAHYTAAAADTDNYVFVLNKQHYEATLKEQDGTVGAAVNVASNDEDVVLRAQDGVGQVTINVGQIDASLALGANTTFTFSTSSANAGTETVGGTFTAKFQIGANQGQSFSMNIDDMRSQALGIAGIAASAAAGEGATFSAAKNVTNGTNDDVAEYSLDVSTHEAATSAIEVINNAIEKVSAQRSQMGAYQNRLEHTINNLGTASENLTAAESRIRDVDMAKEMMNQTKNSILAQAAQAMLAQANQAPQGVLQLLR